MIAGALGCIRIARLPTRWLVEQTKLDAFVQIGVGSDLRQMYTTLVSSSGLGGLTPNTVALPCVTPAYRLFLSPCSILCFTVCSTLFSL